MVIHYEEALYQVHVPLPLPMGAGHYNEVENNPLQPTYLDTLSYNVARDNEII